MDLSTTAPSAELARTRSLRDDLVDDPRPPRSAVSWGAIAAGAAAAAALSLILLMLGVGLGLSTVSPWTRGGAAADAFGVSTIVWLTFTQLVASAAGGYLAGRLRTRWTAVPADEAYFRDTAHGFLAWALASLATAALLTSVIASILGVGAQAGGALIDGAGNAAVAGVADGKPGNGRASMDYFVDSLFRHPPAGAAPADGSAATPAATPAATTTEQTAARDAAEVGRIFLNAGRTQPLSPEDLRYVGQIVAQRTGMSPPDAEKRVADVHARAQAQAHDAEVALRDAADRAREAAATSALWLFVSLLIGAFVASLAATFGGRRRDA